MEVGDNVNYDGALRHAFWLQCTRPNSPRGIDEEGLVGARQQLYQGDHAPGFSDDGAVLGILSCTLPEGTDHVHQHLWSRVQINYQGHPLT